VDYEQGNQIRREGYEPPTVEDIPLRPDEKILAGCKVSGGPGPGVGIDPDCNTCMAQGVS